MCGQLVRCQWIVSQSVCQLLGISNIILRKLKMSLDLNDAAMSGNTAEVIIRLGMGEDPNQKFYPR